MDGPSCTLRTIQAASFDLVEADSIALHSGSYVLNTEKPRTENFVPLTAVKISCPDPFALMIGVTTNGGMKIIVLLGSVQISSGTQLQSLIPGELSLLP